MHKLTYKEKLDRERASLKASGLISECYPGISSIECRMTYYRTGSNQVPMTPMLSFLPSDYSGLHFKCIQEGCMNRGYDFSPTVAAMVKGRKKSTRGKIFCHGMRDSLCGACIAYEVSIWCC